MLLTPQAIAKLAGRIERAFTLRFAKSAWAGPDPRLWEVIARALVEAHRSEPWLPLDPEFFMASQPASVRLADPWTHLSPARAIRRYRRRILRVARGLRRELWQEIRRAEQQIARGRTVESVVRGRERALSPLGRYIVAHRAGRADLARRLAGAAQDQHIACPLYRLASRPFLPEPAYPCFEIIPGLTPTRRVGPRAGGDGLN